jgi:hypothetical protein
MDPETQKPVNENFILKIKEVIQNTSNMIDIEMDRHNQNHSWGACLNTVLHKIQMNADLAEHTQQLSPEISLAINKKVNSITERITHAEDISDAEKENNDKAVFCHKLLQ